jgi:hypothetical protein
MPESERRELEALVQEILQKGAPTERAELGFASERGLTLYPIIQEVNISSSYFQKRCVAFAIPIPCVQGTILPLNGRFCVVDEASRALTEQEWHVASVMGNMNRG